MKRIAILCASSLFVLGTTLKAEETPRTIIDRCFSASSDGDTEAVQNAAKKLRKLRFIENNRDRVDAAYCLRSAYDAQWVYSTDLNRMIPSRLREEIFKAKDTIDKAKEDHSVLNSNRISSDLYQACVALYENDSVAAMTKPLCIDSFVQNGHPSIPTRAEFVSEKLKEELRELNQGDRNLVLDAIVSD